MPHDPVVHFFAYRRQEEVRKSANSAMMGLLAGSRIAEHFLSLTEGCEHLLPTIFPTVDHIKRFNLTSSKAREVLQNADTYLGTMAVPYALAIHEDFLRTCVALTGSAANGISAAGLHAALEDITGGVFHVDSVRQFHVLREMRNAAIHSGGKIDRRVVNRAAQLGTQAVAAWKKVVGRSPVNLVAGDIVELGVGELFLTLATTKVLARQANSMLISALTPEQWADEAVRDFMENGPVSTAKPHRLRKLVGWHRFHYRAVPLTEPQLRAAAARRGLPL